MRHAFIVLPIFALGAVACSGSSSDDAVAPTDSALDVALDSTPADIGTDSSRIDSTAESSADSSSSETGTVDSASDSIADVGDATGKACTATGGECAASEYCAASSCAAIGVCTPRPIASSDFAPVCGCDGVTYWNASYASSLGKTTGATGACTGAGVKACGGFAGTRCPTGDDCIEDRTHFGTCSVADGGGACWAIPSSATCGVGLGGYRQCTGTAGRCTDYCSAVKSKTAFMKDATCPI